MLQQGSTLVIKWLTLLGVMVSMVFVVGCRMEEKSPTMAIINTKEVVTKCNDGIRITEGLQRQFADRRNTLKSQEEGLRKLQSDPALGDAKSGKKEELQRQVQAYTEANQQLRQDVANEEAVQYKPLVDKINKTLADYAKAHGLLGIQDANGFAYIDPSINITKQIIEQVDAAK